MVRARRVVRFVACTGVLWCSPASGQENGIAIGAVTEKLINSSDPSQRQMAQVEAALDALECAAASGALSAAQLDSDSLLAPLRTESRFNELLQRLR